jgi:hypothetical protein
MATEVSLKTAHGIRAISPAPEVKEDGDDDSRRTLDPPKDVKPFFSAGCACNSPWGSHVDRCQCHGPDVGGSARGKLSLHSASAPLSPRPHLLKASLVRLGLAFSFCASVLFLCSHFVHLGFIIVPSAVGRDVFR